MSERRDPRAATIPLRWVGTGQPMIPEWDADNATRMGYLANVFVFACIRAIAEDLAALPFRAGRDPNRPTDFTPAARLARLLGPPPGGPAPGLPARRLWEWTVRQRLIAGRVGWEIERTPAGAVAALWPLVTSNLKPIPTQSGARWFSEFRYGRADKWVTLPADRVFYSWKPSQLDFRESESALQAARLDISVAVMQDRYDFAFLKNDARPAAVVVTEPFAEDEDYEAFKRQFRAEYQGPENAGRTAFLEANGGDGGVGGALDIRTVGLSQKDAAFIERYESKVRGICVALGVPMSRLMDASKRTFSNADRETFNYWQNTLLPLAHDLADDVNMQIAPLLGSEVGWFDTSSVAALQPSSKFQPISVVDAYRAGIVTDVEARGELGLQPEPAGGEFAAGESLPAPGDITVPPAVVPLNSGRAAPIMFATTNVDAVFAANKALLDAEIATTEATPPEEFARRHPHPVDHELRRTRIWRAADSQASALEQRWARAWRREFARQRDVTLDRLRGKRGRQYTRQAVDGEQREAVEPLTLFDVAHWETQAQELAGELFEAVFTMAGSRVAARFGATFDLEAPYVQAFIQDRVTRLAGHVTATTYEQLRDTLADGVAAGEGIPELSARVSHVFDVATETRATTIARTEVIGAYNASAVTVISELPADVVGGVEWIATRDARTRGEHGDADGQVRPVGVAFDVGGESLGYPGDPAGSAGNTINCRCTVAALTPDEMAEGRSSVTVVDFQRRAARVATGSEAADSAIAALGAAPPD